MQLQLRDVGRRNYGMIVARVFRGALKLRYLLLGGAVTGSVTLNRVSFFFTNFALIIDDIFRNMSNGEMDSQT